MKSHQVFDSACEGFRCLLRDVVPHIAEELWARRGGEYSVHQQAWPKYDPEMARDTTFTLVIQVNGKVRDRINVPRSISNEEAKRRALESEHVQRYLDGQPPKRIFVCQSSAIFPNSTDPSTDKSRYNAATFIHVLQIDVLMVRP